MIENDDWPEYEVYVTDPGFNRARVFTLYRQTLRIPPAEAKRLLTLPRVKVARGPRVLVQRIIDEFRAAGATVEIVA